MTITATFLSDILTLLTAHLHLCYMLSLVIYRQQLRSADSLWKLFQGEATYSTCYVQHDLCDMQAEEQTPSGSELIHGCLIWIN